MSLTPCPYCDHRNEEDAKFCSACGGALGLPPHLASCLRCGAVGPVKAKVCYWCAAPLPGRWRRFRTRPFVGAVVVGVGVFAAAAVLGAYAYRQQSPAAAPVSGSEGGGAPAAAESKSVEPDTSPRPGRSPAAAPVTRSPAPGADRAGGREPSRPEPCTEAIAAMGLCTTPAQQKEAGSAAAAEAAIGRPGTTSAGKSGGQKPPQPCTEALAALGLCTPQTTQRRE